MRLSVIVGSGLALVIAATAAQAQNQASQQTPVQAQPAPTGPPGGMGPGHGRRGGMGPGGGNAYGWSIMTPAERQEHMTKLRGFTSYKDCHAYVLEHHKAMAERAKTQGVTLPAEPRRDPCMRLK